MFLGSSTPIAWHLVQPLYVSNQRLPGLYFGLIFAWPGSLFWGCAQHSQQKIATVVSGQALSLTKLTI